MLETRVRQFLAAHSLLEPEDRLLVAYSGGPDSTSLLLLMQAMHPETAAAYVNHQLRGDESRREEEFVRSFCEQRKIPLFVERLEWRKKPSNIEETARKRRYLHLTKIAREHGYSKVALAHHKDDVAETFLQRLLRGSGPHGLSGPALRRGIFIRPLLAVSRDEIRSYLKERDVPYFIDTSNMDPRFVRNRIRHELLPYLEKNYNPQIRETLSRTALWIREQNRLLAELLKPFEHCIRVENGVVRVLKRDMKGLSDPLKKELLRLALQQADPTLRPDSGLFGRLLRTLEMEENLELPGFLMVESTPEAIVFAAKSGPAGHFEMDVPGPGTYAFLPGESVLLFTREPRAEFTGNPDVVYVDAEKAEFPLTVRNWKKGDRFQPLGMTGSRKLSDFWIDRKVPRAERTRVPLVLKNDNLVWVAGFRLNHEFRITESTKTVLRIELKRAHVQTQGTDQRNST